jgi:hypothetical protein
LHFLFVYLIGSLLALGIGGSLVIDKSYEKTGLSKISFLLWQMVFSWLSVAAFIIGILIVFVGGNGDED